MFANAVTLFSIKGFEIKIDPSWLIIAALVTWSLAKEYFPNTLPTASGIAHYTMAVFGMLGFFISLLLHELAHSIVARYLGVPIKSITLFIFGGMAELGADPISARDEFWIAIVGPAMSFCLAFAFWILAHISGFVIGSQTTGEVFAYLSAVNLVVAIFNLIPAFPLDGGRVLRAYLWHRDGDMLAATKTASRAGTALGYGLMLLGIMTLFQGAIVAGMWQLMIGAFVVTIARASYAAQFAHTVFEHKPVHALMAHNPITVSPDVTLSEFVNQIMLRHGVGFVPVVEGDVLLGHIDKAMLSNIDRENWGNTRVGDVFVGLDADTMIAPTLLVPALLKTIAQTGRRKFLVVKDHKLVGVITLADLASFLSQYDLSDHRKSAVSEM